MFFAVLEGVNQPQGFVDTSSEWHVIDDLVADSPFPVDQEESPVGFRHTVEYDFPFLVVIIRAGQDIIILGDGHGIIRNQGIFKAEGEIILLTDADMVAGPKFVAEHLKAHESHKNVAIEGLTYNLKKLVPDYQHPDNVTPYIKQKLKMNDIFDSRFVNKVHSEPAHYSLI